MLAILQVCNKVVLLPHNHTFWGNHTVMTRNFLLIHCSNSLFSARRKVWNVLILVKLALSPISSKQLNSGTPENYPRGKISHIEAQGDGKILTCTRAISFTVCQFLDFQSALGSHIQIGGFKNQLQNLSKGNIWYYLPYKLQFCDILDHINNPWTLLMDVQYIKRVSILTIKNLKYRKITLR